MFTGLIEALGKVKAIAKTGGSGKITIESDLSRDLTIGGSIAVDGACLSVTSRDDKTFTADVSSESLRATTLGEIKVGDSLNLERPVTATAPLGGHFVTGHVDCKGAVVRYDNRGDFVVIGVDIPKELRQGLVPKGSVTLDGVSLTVVTLTGNGFETTLIPETLKTTTLGSKRVGSFINVETDILGKYVLRYLKAGKDADKGETITEEFLSERGFIKR